MRVNDTARQFYKSFGDFDPQDYEFSDEINGEYSKDYPLDIVVRAQELKNRYAGTDITKEEFEKQKPSYQYTNYAYYNATPSIIGYEDDWNTKTREYILNYKKRLDNGEPLSPIPQEVLKWAQQSKDSLDWSKYTRTEILEKEKEYHNAAKISLEDYEEFNDELHQLINQNWFFYSIVDESLYQWGITQKPLKEDPENPDYKPDKEQVVKYTTISRSILLTVIENLSNNITVPDELVSWAQIEVGDYSSDTSIFNQIPEEILTWAHMGYEEYRHPYTDVFYLKFAQNELIIKNHERIRANMIMRTAGLDIPEGVWAQFTYEEILEMEDAGVSIPEEVLEWAHGQLDQDFTAQEVLTDKAKNESITEGEEDVLDNDKNKLTTFVKKYIVKVESSQQQIEEKFSEFQEIQEKTIDLKDKKQDMYDSIINNINKKTDRITYLTNKKNDGTITKSEEQEYDKLISEVNSNSEDLIELNEDKTILDSYNDCLSNLNSMMYSSEKHTAKLQLAIFSLATVKQDITPDTSSNNDNIDMPEISLVVLSNNAIANIITLMTDLNTSFAQADFKEVSSFAQEYAQAIEDTKDKIQSFNENETQAQENTMSLPDETPFVSDVENTKEPDTEEETELQEEETSDNQSNSSNSWDMGIPFDRMLNASPSNALYMSDYTNYSTDDLLEKENTVQKAVKSQQERVSNLTDNVSETEREVERTVQEHTKNAERMDSLLSILKYKKQAYESETQERQDEQEKEIAENREQVQELIDNPEDENTPEISEISSQTESNISEEQNDVISQINRVSNDDKRIISTSGRHLLGDKRDVIISESQNEELDKLNKMISSRQLNALLISQTANMGGAFTIAKGISNLFWHRLYALAQIITGGLELEAGVRGTVASTNVSSQIPEFETAHKDSQDTITSAQESSEASEEMLQNIGLENTSQAQYNDESQSDEIEDETEDFTQEDIIPNEITELADSENDEVTIAQGASANVNASERTVTDDKQNRATERFNSQQQDEARRRVRRVNGVFRTQNGNV